MLRRYSKFTKIMIYLSVVVFILVITFLKVEREIKPVFLAASDSEVRIAATECINGIIKDEMSNDSLYGKFVNIKNDNNGDIASIELNAVEMNKLGSNVALRVQKEMKTIGKRGIKIPLGVVTGSTLLSYWGPGINVKMVPVGYVTCKYESELQSAGINQTKYMVYIQVAATMRVLIPLAKDKTDVISTIPIAETLIVGKVPAIYANGSSGSSSVITVPVADGD